jgi:hypothetical protein
MTGLSWYDVRDFLIRLNQRAVEGSVSASDGGGVGVCLSGRHDDGFYHGSDITRLDDFAWYAENWEAGAGFHPVGQLRPNRWGLYDMLGNAWEWVWDGYDPLLWYGAPRSTRSVR